MKSKNQILPIIWTHKFCIKLLGSSLNLKKTCRLRAELDMKDGLLSKFMYVSFAQSKRFTLLKAAFQDTVSWDPSTCARPSSFFTPKDKSLDEEEVVRRPRGRFDETQKPPLLCLLNHFASLAANTLAPSAAAIPDFTRIRFPCSSERSHWDPREIQKDLSRHHFDLGPEDQLIRIRRASPAGTPHVLLASDNIFFPTPDPEGGHLLPLQRCPHLAAIADKPSAAR